MSLERLAGANHVGHREGLNVGWSAYESEASSPGPCRSQPDACHRYHEHAYAEGTVPIRVVRLVSGRLACICPGEGNAFETVHHQQSGYCHRDEGGSPKQAAPWAVVPGTRFTISGAEGSASRSFESIVRSLKRP